jgi:hypothetical protein
MLYHPDLVSLSPILDFEASSLSDTSYPISAGLVIGGYVHYWIIKPKPEWIDWSLQSQAIHGLKRSFLEDYGVQADQVYKQMASKLLGHQVVYSHAPEWESLWLGRLGSFSLRVDDIREMIGEGARHDFSAELTKIFAAYKLTHHRADHDALAIALAVKSLRMKYEY